MMPTVQKELELVDDQKAKLKEAGEKAQAAMRELFSGMRDLSEEDRRAKMAEVGKKMTAQGEQMKKAIEEILLPHQLERLRGIAIQIVGVPALNDKEVQQSLKLTEEQTAKMKSIYEEAGKKMRELFGEGRPDFRTIGPKMQEIGKETQKQLLDVLTDEQKTSFEKMKGEKLEIPASELRGPGGPGGPGGPRPPAKTSE
jgi:Spy/CpxP family protein refolding chaperone